MIVVLYNLMTVQENNAKTKAKLRCTSNKLSQIL